MTGTLLPSPDLAAYGEAVQVGEHEVEEDDVGVVAAERLEALVATAGLGHVVALVLEGQPQHPADPRVVFDEQHTSRHASQRRNRPCAPAAHLLGTS